VKPDSTHRVIEGRYEILRTLGRGSFGHTFLAHDREKGRDVALKMLDARNAPDWKAFELFEREVAVLRGLRHHGVPEVFDSFRDAWEDREAAFLVMEYVEGTSLEEMIAAGQHRDAAEITRLLLDLLGVLEYLHERVPPILHRDIKPANIVVRANGSPALVDFGAVRNVFAGPEDGGSTVVGTFGYMPYEQYMGQATPSSDLYALAATMLHLLTGRAPREFMTDGGRIEVPEALPGERMRAILARMLQPSPSDRYASARDARNALVSEALLPARRPVAPLAHSVAPLPDFGPAPRSLKGDAKKVYDNIAYSVWQLMNSSNKDAHPSPVRVLGMTLLALASFGLMPAILIGMAAEQRRRLRFYFRNGLPAVARILAVEPTAGDWKLARVTYEFEADGLLHRDSDEMLPRRAVRLQPGEEVHVLYIPSRNYNSVIISA
jgi:serine/threonine protein kinase